MDETRKSFIAAVRDNWRSSLLAVLAGNVVYFLIVEPRLPAHLRHEAFHIDLGLSIDFAICLVLLVVFQSFQKK
jgi:hypothetical protein